MKIHVFGAAGGEVTGSLYLVQTDQANLAVDCGMFQGSKWADQRNRMQRELNIRTVHGCVLTHAHLDHTGRLPLAFNRGYRGPVYCTPATADMAALILRDAARIQESESERTNRRRRRDGLPPAEPLYSRLDAEGAISLLKPVPYDKPVAVAPGITVRFVEAGHMLGSSFLDMTVQDRGRTLRVVFSGDLGPRNAPILREFGTVTGADVVFMESTYGGREHKDLDETVAEFRDIVRNCVQSRGKMLVPTFAVGRAQLLLYILAGMFRRKEIKPFPIFLDSPMAFEATKNYVKHPELFDEDLLQIRKEQLLHVDLRTVQATTSAKESRALEKHPGPCMILAGAGMCNAGRIVNHLRAGLSKPDTAVLIVGYQGKGSLGRRLVEGATHVSIMGERVPVKASIHTMGGFSAHAGQSDLMKWFDPIAPSKPRLILIHGEDESRKALADAILQKHGIQAALPNMEEVIEI